MNANLQSALASALTAGIFAFPAMAAASAAEPEEGSSGCTLPAALSHPLMERDGGLAVYASMPEPCLKTMYLYCSAASERVVLGQHAMMVCSLGHEALLKGVFGGNLDALLAWWRAHRR